MLFKQKKAYLHDGTEVRLGDKIRFTNSDGEECIGEIEREINNPKNPKRLFFLEQ